MDEDEVFRQYHLCPVFFWTLLSPPSSERARARETSIALSDIPVLGQRLLCGRGFLADFLAEPRLFFFFFFFSTPSV